MKKLIVFIKLMFVTILIAHSQVNCNELTNSYEYQMCWYKDFSIYKHLIPVDSIEKYRNYEVGLNNYITKGNATPWAGVYSPWFKGGIAYRWQTGEVPKADNLIKWEELINMSDKEINELSPAEKFDIYLGNLEFRITWWELKNRGTERIQPAVPSEGFCNGVRAAGAIFSEPIKPVTVVSKWNSNIKVTFYPADLKALAGATYFVVEDYAQLGCNNSNNTKCNQPQRDINPALLDISMRLTLGKYEKVIIADGEYGEDIYNETFFGYERKIISKQRNEVTIELKVNSLAELYEYNDINKETKSKVENLEFQYPTLKEYTYQYKLLIDSENKITGGEWISEERPDFIWFLIGQGKDEFDIYDELVEYRALPEDKKDDKLNNKYIYYSPIYNLIKMSSGKN